MPLSSTPLAPPYGQLAPALPSWSSAGGDPFAFNWASLVPLYGAGVNAIGSLVGASLQAGAATTSAQITADASGKAAELQAQAQANSLAFQEAQAENTYQNDAVVRLANYNQWAAETARKGSIGQLFGLPAVNIPAYVPGIDPRYTSGGSSVPGLVGPSAATPLSTSIPMTTPPLTYPPPPTPANFGIGSWA